jgi:hypothetical protein
MRPGHIHGSARRADPGAEPGRFRLELTDAATRQVDAAADAEDVLQES